MLPDAIRAVTFDVGRTLLHPTPSVGDVYAAVSHRNGLRLDPADAERRFLEAWRQVQESHHGLVYGTDEPQARFFWRKVVREVCRHLTPTDAQVEALLGELYDRFSRADHWRIDEAWPAVLAACRRRGLKVALLSNWDVRLRPLLADIGLLDVVDAVVISAEVALEKPNPAIFRLALERLGATPAETVHVGNTWQDDIVGARAAGLTAVWLADAPRPDFDDAIPHLRIPQLGALVPLLE